MAESRKAKSAAGPGWLATLLGGLVLVVLGFGLGLVAGAAYEEPKLVAEHIAGRTVDVPLPSQPQPEPAAAPGFGAPADEPPPIEEPLRAAAPAPTPTPEPAARPSPPPEPPPVAAAPSPRDGFRIQVGAFGDIEGARKLRGELRAAGFPAEIHEVGSGARFKVRVGPIGTRGEAEATARKLESQRKLPTWILAPGKG